MNKTELQNALRAKGIAFNASDNVQTLQSLYDTAVSNNAADELQKKIDDLGGFSFSDQKFQDLVKKQKAREFPDFGRDVPTEDVYVFIGKGNVHQWTSPRTGNVSDILTVILQRKGTDEIVEVAAAGFCKREWDFLEQSGKNSEGKYVYTTLECNPVLPFAASIADRNAAVAAIEVGTELRVKHSARGHFDNPNSTRVWDFVYTWVEKA